MNYLGANSWQGRFVFWCVAPSYNDLARPLAKKSRQIKTTQYRKKKDNKINRRKKKTQLKKKIKKKK
jgi:hypothetical protein